jgi:hypothetical protein
MRLQGYSETGARKAYNALGIPYEDRLPIMLRRGIRRPLPQLWPALEVHL